QALGHRRIVIVQPTMGEWLGHAGVAFQRVMFLNAFNRLLYARIFFRHAAVNQALDASVGHAAVAGESAVGVRAVHFSFATVGRGIYKAAIVRLGCPGGAVVFAFEILATADEDCRFLQRRIVLWNAGRLYP